MHTYVLSSCMTWSCKETVICMIVYLSMAEGKDKETVQSRTTLDPGHRMGKLHKDKKTASHTGEPRSQPFPNR